MMRSLSTGVSGLRAHQTKMDVIAHNIANVNTVAFKASRATFAEMFSQNIAGASRANDATGRGGVNPRQIGLGTNLSSIDRLMSNGAAQITDNPFDIAIQGDGFFAVGDATGTYFTRAGALNIDEQGNLVTVGGMRVLGWDAVPDANNPGEFMVVRAAVQPINLSGSKEYISPTATTQIDFLRNLNADANNGIHDSTMQFFDSLGNSYTVDVRFTYTPGEDDTPGQWDFRIGNYAYLNGNRDKPFRISTEAGAAGVKNITFEERLDSAAGIVPFPDEDATATPPVPAPVTHPLTFGTNGLLETGGDLVLNIGSKPNVLQPNATFGKDVDAATGVGKLDLNFEKLTQFGGESNSPATSDPLDGGPAGRLNGISIAPDGRIMGNYTNGMLRVLGQIPIAQFSNPAGLSSIGGNLFMATENSGIFDGVGMEGNMKGGTLEMSNVDIAQEFTEMITTQRGFQANSRVISTSDDILQELVNIKR